MQNHAYRKSEWLLGALPSFKATSKSQPGWHYKWLVQTAVANPLSNPANHDDLSIQALSAKPFQLFFCAVHGQYRVPLIRVNIHSIVAM